MFYATVMNCFTNTQKLLGVFDSIEELSTALPVSTNGSDLALYGLKPNKWEVVFFRLSNSGSKEEISDPRIFIEDLANPVDHL